MNKQLLADLCAIDGVSGHEHQVRDFILARLAESTVPMKVHVDNMGNVIVHLIGKEKANTVLQLDAHMDEVGFIITGISEDGYLRFDTVGGIDQIIRRESMDDDMYDEPVEETEDMDKEPEDFEDFDETLDLDEEFNDEF